MPIITGIRDKYNVNDIVNLNCSTTILNAQLSWFINGKKVNNTYLTKYDKNPNNNGESILNLRFQMEKKYFQTEEIELQCTVYYIKIIADFQEQIIIRTFNSEYLLSQSSTFLSIFNNPLFAQSLSQGSNQSASSSGATVTSQSQLLPPPIPNVSITIIK